MLPNQQMVDNNGKQVALFPLEAFYIIQPWWDTYSHEGGQTYYATDFTPYNREGQRIFRAPCYAPVDIRLLWKESQNCVALWQSVEKVRFADGSLDYLGIIVYHDNDIQTNNYSNIGDIKRQGEIFNRSGTGGNVTGDHLHLETGKGEVNLNDYRYHFKDNSSCKRIKPDEALFINDTRIIPSQYDNGYNWIEYDGGITPPPHPSGIVLNKKKFKWVLYANKLRKRKF